MWFFKKYDRFNVPPSRVFFFYCTIRMCVKEAIQFHFIWCFYIIYKKTPALIGSICHIWACSIFSFLGQRMSNSIFFTEYIYYSTRSNCRSLEEKISQVWKNGNSAIVLTFEAVLELWLLQFWYYEQSNRVRLIEDWILCRFLFLLFIGIIFPSTFVNFQFTG